MMAEKIVEAITAVRVVLSPEQISTHPAWISRFVEEVEPCGLGDIDKVKELETVCIHS